MRDIKTTLVILALILIWVPAGAQEIPMPPDNRPTVILGASYAAAWPISELAGRRIINRGVDGNQSHEMNARFAQDVLEEDPAQVILWGFINDIFRSDPDNYETTKQRVLDGYEEMIEAARANNIEVVIATEVTIREPSGFSNWISAVIGKTLGKKSYQDMINDHVSEVNRKLEELARSHDIAVLDFEKLLADASGKRNSEYAVEDGSHLSEAAYDALSAFTTRVMNADRSAQEVE